MKQTKIKVRGSIALWLNTEDMWVSTAEPLMFMLNVNHRNNVMSSGANPWPAGIAVELAQSLFPDLKVIEMEDEPEYNDKLIY